MGRQGAVRKMVRLGAGARTLVVPAPMKMPIGFELGAGRGLAKILFDPAPGRPAVALHVVGGDCVRDALKAQRFDQPIEQFRRVVVLDGSDYATPPEASSQVIKIRWRPGEPTNGADQSHRIVEIGTLNRLQGQCCLPSISVSSNCKILSRAHQISDMSRRWLSESPSMYRWVVTIDGDSDSQRRLISLIRCARDRIL